MTTIAYLAIRTAGLHMCMVFSRHLGGIFPRISAATIRAPGTLKGLTQLSIRFELR